MEVNGKVFYRDKGSDASYHSDRLSRCTDANRVTQRDLVATVLIELLGQLSHTRRIDRAFVRATKYT